MVRSRLLSRYERFGQAFVPVAQHTGVMRNLCLYFSLSWSDSHRVTLKLLGTESNVTVMPQYRPMKRIGY
jgi:hypothetical protein